MLSAEDLLKEAIKRISKDCGDPNRLMAGTWNESYGYMRSIEAVRSVLRDIGVYANSGSMKMSDARKKYYEYKESVDKGYSGGLIPEITDYVTELEYKSGWVEFWDMPPTLEPLGQVHILFYHPDWACPFQGLYTHDLEKSLEERLMVYNCADDRFYGWNHGIPKYWMKIDTEQLK